MSKLFEQKQRWR